MHILIVEDFADTARLLSRLLGSLGTVHTARTVQEALDMAGRVKYDLFLLDIQLKEERTGLDLMLELRGSALYKDVPMIACTAYASATDRERLLASGFDGYVAKPFENDHLLKVVKHHWQKRKQNEDSSSRAAPVSQAPP